jgi:hypothetical protein
MTRKLNDYKKRDEVKNIDFNNYSGILCVCGGQAEK